MSQNTPLNDVNSPSLGAWGSSTEEFDSLDLSRLTAFLSSLKWFNPGPKEPINSTDHSAGWLEIRSTLFSPRGNPSWHYHSLRTMRFILPFKTYSSRGKSQLWYIVSPVGTVEWVTLLWHLLEELRSRQGVLLAIKRSQWTHTQPIAQGCT